MAFTTVPSVVSGQTYSAANYNTYIKDNLAAIWVYTTAGDIVYAASATTLSRLGVVQNGVLIGGASAPQWLAIGSIGNQLGVVAGAPAWVDGVPGLFTAAGDWVYGSGADAAAILAKPANTKILQEASDGTPSWRSIILLCEIQIVPSADDVDTLSGIGFFYVPLSLNGFNLSRAQAFVGTPGVTGATTIQVRNLVKYPTNDSLSVAISIASGATVGTPGTIDTARDDVSTDDLIKIYVTAQSSTKPKGLWAVLEFTLP